MQEKFYQYNTQYKDIVTARHPDIVWRQPPWIFAGKTTRNFDQWWTEIDYENALVKATVSDHGEIHEVDLYPWGFVAWIKE